MANAKKPEDMTRAELVERLRELERADARRDELEALLRDREELTAIGRLAGAVARDFNNHLTVIATRAALVRRAWSNLESQGQGSSGMTSDVVIGNRTHSYHLWTLDTAIFGALAPFL